MPVRQRSCDNAAAASWAGVDSDGFLGRSQVARWIAFVCMAKKLLNHQTSMLARVYVHFFALIVACTK